MIIDFELSADADDELLYFDLEQTADDLGARLKIQKLESAS